MDNKYEELKGKIEGLRSWIDFHVTSSNKKFHVITEWNRLTEINLRKIRRRFVLIETFSIISLLLSIANLIW